MYVAQLLRGMWDYGKDLRINSTLNMKIEENMLHNLFHQCFFRFYSLQWRTWAACFIQAAWRRCRKKKAEKALREAEELSDFGSQDGYSTSPSFAATVYVKRFASNALRPLRSGKRNKVPQTQRLLPLLPQKPAEPDFTTREN